MRAKYELLIETLLRQSDTMTASQLAKALGVSERSIKNYIAEINHQEKELIRSSRKGYEICRERAVQLLGNSRNEIPETPTERVSYILTQLLFAENDGVEGIDLYDMADDLFVSIETLKKDMVKVRRHLKEFNLYVNMSNACAFLEGKEADKRRLLSSILYDEFNENVMSLEAVQKAFPDFDLELLRNIIEEQCKKFHYFINGYALLNLVLDIVISMERIRHNCTYRSHMALNRNYGIREAELSEQIAGEIEKHFRIRFTGLELEELTVLLIGHLMKIDYNELNRENIGDVVGEKCLGIVNRLLQNINENYYIDVDNDDFFIRFTIHISNLLTRIKYDYMTKNPLTEQIKMSCPLIFDCAVSVANCLREITGSRIDEDEIAYIALHIGSNLEMYEKQKNKQSCVLLSPQYYDFADGIMSRLEQAFGDCLVVKTVVTSRSECRHVKKEDFLLTTIAMDGYDGEVIQITPFVNDRDIVLIRRTLEEIKRKKNMEHLRCALEEITGPNLFRRNGNFQNQSEALAFMVRRMEEEGYVGPDFMTDVLERESHSSTAFNQVAVPHSLKQDALKTGMFILLNEKPIVWGKNIVNVVLLFAINRSGQALFHEIFDNLVVLLLEQQHLERVLRCETYEQFINAIIECVE